MISTMPVDEARCARLRVGDTVTLEKHAVRHPRCDADPHVRSRSPHALRPAGPRRDPHRAERAARSPVARRMPAGYTPFCIGTTTSHAHGALHAAADATRGRAHHHRQGRDGCGHARRRFANSAAPISRSSAAPRRWRRPGSKRSRTSTWTISIPKACGSSAFAASGRCCVGDGQRTAASCITRSTQATRDAPRRGAREHRRRARCKSLCARIRDRHPHPRRRRRGAVRRAACARRRIRDLDVTIAVKGLLGKCGCTRMVQGGYNVALAPGDSVERHFMDTIEGGKWLHDQDLAWTLVTGAIERIRELENELGCFFDRNPDGTVHQKAFAGQTFDRTVHKGDLTGIEIINRLAEQVWARGDHRLEEHRALEFIRAARRVALAGVLMLDMRTRRAVLVQAQGGAARDRRRSDDVPLPHAVGRQELRRAGDGAARRPAAARHGDGAVPSDRAARGHRHAHDRDRARRRACAAPAVTCSTATASASCSVRSARRARDARHRRRAPSSREMRAGYTTPNGGVYLAWGISAPTTCGGSSRAWSSAAPTAASISPAGRVEVVPTAHYMMGGVEFDADCTTAMPGLFVAGEDSGGVHGANRLGGNGVANSTVFGGIAGDAMAAARQRRRRASADEAAIERRRSRARAARSSAAVASIMRRRCARRFTPHVGRRRHRARCRGSAPRRRDRCKRCRRARRAIGLPSRRARAPSTSRGTTGSISPTSSRSARSSSRPPLARKNSRGAHFRADFPDAGDLDASTYTRVRQQDASLAIDAVPVRFTRVRPGQSLISD